jgi:hypothetical protein
VAARRWLSIALDSPLLLLELLGDVPSLAGDLVLLDADRARLGRLDVNVHLRCGQLRVVDLDLDRWLLGDVDDRCRDVDRRGGPVGEALDLRRLFRRQETPPRGLGGPGRYERPFAPEKPLQGRRDVRARGYLHASMREGCTVKFLLGGGACVGEAQEVGQVGGEPITACRAHEHLAGPLLKELR